MSNPQSDENRAYYLRMISYCSREIKRIENEISDLEEKKTRYKEIKDSLNTACSDLKEAINKCDSILEKLNKKSGYWESLIFSREETAQCEIEDYFNKLNDCQEEVENKINETKTKIEEKEELKENYKTNLKDYENLFYMFPY